MGNVLVAVLQQWCCGGCYFGGSTDEVVLKQFCCGNGGIETTVVLKNVGSVPVML